MNAEKLCPGDVLLHESDSDYRAKAREHLSSHALADFRKIPLLYWRKKQGLVPDEDRPAYIIGRAAHALILEGRKAFENQFAVGGPTNPTTGKPYGPYTKAYADWAAAQRRPVITDEQYDLIHNLRRAVRAHAVAVEDRHQLLHQA